MDETDTAVKIAALNDLLRKGGFGGTVYFTSGVRQRGSWLHCRGPERLQDFDDFTPDNDPHGEHDFGAVRVPEQGVLRVNAAFSGRLRKVFWKIDYYAPGMTNGSDDPSDPANTARVMNVMLA